MALSLYAHRIFGLSATAGGLLLSGCETAAPREASPPAATASQAKVEAPSVPLASAAPSAAREISLVSDPSLVCMVNNQFMGRPQIPVQVAGKTYYGCCAMCQARLESDASARTATDPVSQAPVDKATAVIGKTDRGAALYFASRQTFDTYVARSRQN